MLSMQPTVPARSETTGEGQLHADGLRLLTSGLPEVAGAPGQQTWKFIFSPFDPHPSWLPNLHGFPVVPFADDGTPEHPDGSDAKPFHFAINARVSDEIQIHAACSLLIGTLRRQATVSRLLAGELDVAGMAAQASEDDEQAKLESTALTRMIQIRRWDDAAAVLGRHGPSLRIGWLASIYPDEQRFRSRVAFFARCYNHIPEVRDAIDRIVSALIGPGPRVVSTSDWVRRKAEQMTLESMSSRFIAHAARDSELAGVGILVAGIKRHGPGFRVVRPDRARLDSQGGETVVQELCDERWCVVRGARAMPGAAQPQTPYGLSVLEPFVQTLITILEIGEPAKQMKASVKDTPQVPDGLLSHIEAATAMGDTARDTLRMLLQPITAVFPEPSVGMYFRGHEDWP